MGKRTTGIYSNEKGAWEVDKWIDGVRLRERFSTFEDAEAWLIRAQEARRVARVHGPTASFTFDQAAGRFISENRHLASIQNYADMLKPVMPFVGNLLLEEVHMGTLKPFVEARKAEGCMNKTINLSLSAVRRVLNLAAGVWRDEATTKAWLLQAPKITMLPLVGEQREPRPISWKEQDALFAQLPEHLADMAEFVVNTGVRNGVVCNLEWEWEIPVPELGISVFEVPRKQVKGRKLVRVIVCNSRAQAVIERVRGRHPQYVFAMEWRNHPLGPIETMSNTAWQSARVRAGLNDLHVHDLRHTTGMRLREAGIQERTIADILWHSTGSITGHYSMAQIIELRDALEAITKPAQGWNKTLQTLKAEHLARRRGEPGNSRAP